jgi:glycosyltransferase involved in cell wall biosynthesis
VKGIDDVLLALANVRKAQPELDWCFSIIGDGPERAALETLSARLDLQDRVQFHGSLPHHEVLSHLEKSAVFVMPSWNEAFGLAYLEAMTMGCAVIGCFENGAADIVTDRIDGRLVPPRDVESLAQVLSELVMDTKQREALSSAAKESVKRFSWPANARAVIEALDG